MLGSLTRSFVSSQLLSLCYAGLRNNNNFFRSFSSRCGSRIVLGWKKILIMYIYICSIVVRVCNICLSLHLDALPFGICILFGPLKNWLEIWCTWANNVSHVYFTTSWQAKSCFSNPWSLRKRSPFGEVGGGMTILDVLGLENPSYSSKLEFGTNMNLSLPSSTCSTRLRLWLLKKLKDMRSKRYCNDGSLQRTVPKKPMEIEKNQQAHSQKAHWKDPQRGLAGLRFWK